MYNSLLLPWSTSPSKAEQVYRAAGLVRTKGTIFLLPPPESQLRQAFNAPPRPKTRMSSGAVALCKHFERMPVASEVLPSRTSTTATATRLATTTTTIDGNERCCSASSETTSNSNNDSNDETLNPTATATSSSTSTSSTPPSASIQNNNPPRPSTATATATAPQTSSHNPPQRTPISPPHPYWPLPTGSNALKTLTAEATLDKILRHAVWRNVMLLHENVAVYEVRTREGWGMRWSLGVVERKTKDGDGDKGEGEGGWEINKVTFRGLLEPIAGLDCELDVSVDGDGEGGNMAKVG